MKSLPQFLPVFLLILACAGFLGALAAGPGARAGLWDFRAGFTVLRWSAYAAGAAAILAALTLVLLKFSGGSLWQPPVIAALLLGLIVFSVPYFTVREFRKLPTVADATTNMDDPPVFISLERIRMETAQNPLAYRYAEAAELQRQYFPDLKTIETRATPAEVVAVARDAALDMGLEIVAAVPAEGRLEATVTSFWFGFKDDVVLRARAQPDGKTLIDIRSASRVGRLDGGVNGKRVRQLMKKLQTR